MRVPRTVQEALTLSSSKGRLWVFGCLSAAIFVVPYHWLDHLSLWGDIGIHSAPSIGLTRAYWLLLHGNPVAAWHRNALIYAVLAVGLPLMAIDVVRLRQRRTALSLTSETPENSV